MAALPHPEPPLADEVVGLRAWRRAGVPAGLMTFADPSVLRFSWPSLRPYTERDARAYFAERRGFMREGGLRSQIAFRGTRRDTVMFSLLVGELR